jgi:hypothetical protein
MRGAVTTMTEHDSGDNMPVEKMTTTMITATRTMMKMTRQGHQVIMGMTMAMMRGRWFTLTACQSPAPARSSTTRCRSRCLPTCQTKATSVPVLHLHGPQSDGDTMCDTRSRLPCRISPPLIMMITSRPDKASPLLCPLSPSPADHCEHAPRHHRHSTLMTHRLVTDPHGEARVDALEARAGGNHGLAQAVRQVAKVRQAVLALVLRARHQ